MNKHIEQFKAYLLTNEQPLLQTPFFKLCKQVYDSQEATIKQCIGTITECIDGKETIKKSGIRRVIKSVGTKNRGREATVFVLAVTASALYDVDWKVPDVLPNIDYDAEVQKGSVFLKSALLGFGMGILFGLY